ncbi:DUF3488 and transglutaminase-like domain-containing protein [Glaciecola petra]|uniref:DUF3488 and transglutaminase-like domain-containing protein n=1 Tax=Glaciecola petra TaxID=3075602 RepID=A0ABU2ZNC9_9ALTE|nr:DUF3488 and transglutaminase-like domain-containing protein [Aestuariibacter sp. P117]MDT0594136.1 DUF3488 and transglutaminase-like domain-containing protein [Aestuariibacter sp. P117]
MKAYVDKNLNSLPVYGSLIAVFFLLLITLHEPMMTWVWILSLCSIIIAIARIKKRLEPIKNLTLNLLAIFCMLLLIYMSGSFGLMATMVNLLVVACCLKIINLHTKADYHLILIVLFFLIACGFVYNQSVYLVLYYFVCLIMLFLTAFFLNRGVLSIGKSIKQSLKMIFQASPIMLVLFIVVPRFPPFWQTQIEKSTETGLSEQVTPGDIASLAQSDDLVFRAEFENNNVPNSQDRYFRSIVLDYFDGSTWSVAREPTPYDSVNKFSFEFEDTQETSQFRYLIIAEPANTRWLYSLDIPLLEENMGDAAIFMNQQYQLYQNEVSTKSNLYIISSYTNARLDVFKDEVDFSRYLQVPTDSNPRTQEWVAETISEEMTFTDKVDAINQLFLTQAFTYTLKPPLMSINPVDTFMFEYQKGFCSHYASAMTYMLRIAGVPARMVTGYQGGEIQGENILTVRQYDAHAWVEAYDDKLGWVRFDPTSLVAPNRTLLGLLSALNNQESEVFARDIKSFFDFAGLSVLDEKLSILDHNWNQFVLGFNQDAQSNIITSIFGELSKQSLTQFLLLTIALIGLFLAVLFLPYRSWFTLPTKTPLSLVFKSLSKLGYEKQAHETLASFVDRIKPSIQEAVFGPLEHFTELYYRATYQRNYDTPDVHKPNNTANNKHNTHEKSVANDMVNVIEGELIKAAKAVQLAIRSQKRHSRKT